MTKRQKIFSAVGQFLKNVFTRNIPLKIIALVFALLLWGYVLSEEKPKYVKRVPDVSIELLNENRLTEREWEVVDVNPSTVDVSIEAGIDMHSALTAQTVKCTVNLGQIVISGQDSDQKTVKLDVVVTTPEGTVKKVSDDQVEVTIERVRESGEMTAVVKTEGSFPAIVKADDDLPEYYECILKDTVAVPSVRGLKSEIEEISSAEVTLNLSSFDDSDLEYLGARYRRILPVVFKDVNGNVISNSSTNSVTVLLEDIEIRRYKEVPIRLNVTSDAIDLSLYDAECEFAPDASRTVRIYGSASELAKVREIYTDPISLKLAYVDNDKPREVGLAVPDGINVKLERETTSVVPSITVREVKDAEFDVKVEYTEPDKDFILEEKTETIKVRVSGLADAMLSFDANRFTASADLTYYRDGTFDVPFMLKYNGTDLHVKDYVVAETEDGEEPKICITFVSAEGAAYQIELTTTVVKVRIAAVPIEGAD